ncbi:MAG: GNAT family N-acetyltransferase [Streptosporangiaceae bacterium]
MSDPNCVGALIRDRHNRVYLQRRSLQRRQLPGAWDIVGGHVEPGETAEAALAREVMEETGWQLRRIEAIVADWEWSYDGVVQHELDYLIEVNGDLGRPRLEEGKHDKFFWASYDNPEAVRSQHDVGNDALWDIVRHATRIRLTGKVRLEPVSASSVRELRRLRQGGPVALDGRPQETGEVSGFAEQVERWWDKAEGYTWLAHRRGGQQSAFGLGSLMRVRGADEFVLHCLVVPDERMAGAAVEMVQALLAFGLHELKAERIIAYVSAKIGWAVEVATRSGMRVTGSEGSTYVFSVEAGCGHVPDLDSEVVTGIGEILAIPH